jgi:hypothetical protein
MLERNVSAAVIGWPEKLFARVNALVPGVLDAAITRQLPVIRRYARQPGAPAPATDNRNLRRQAI